MTSQYFFQSVNKHCVPVDRRMHFAYLWTEGCTLLLPHMVSKGCENTMCQATRKLKKGNRKKKGSDCVPTKFIALYLFINSKTRKRNFIP